MPICCRKPQVASFYSCVTDKQTVAQILSVAQNCATDRQNSDRQNEFGQNYL